MKNILQPRGQKMLDEFISVDVSRNCLMCGKHSAASDQGQAYLITKTCLYNFDPLKPHFYIVKLGFTGVYIIFLILLKNIDCGYLLEPHRRGGSNEYSQSMF